MINAMCITDFNLENKDEIIEYVKLSNANIQALKKINISWIDWRTIPKKAEADIAGH